MVMVEESKEGFEINKNLKKVFGRKVPNHDKMNNVT